MEIKDTESIQSPSPLQEAILLETSDPRSACGQSVFILEGSVNAGELENAASAATRRHSILRTFFLFKRVDRPLQVVHAQPRVTLDHGDWRDLPEDERSARAEALLREDLERGIDPGKPGLYRLSIRTMGDHSHLLVLTYHRTILDKWTARLLVRELLGSYAGSQAAPARSYCDAIRWMKDRTSSEVEDFWRHTLKDFGSPTSLVLGRASTVAPEKPTHFSTQSRQLPSDLVDRLSAAIRVSGVSATAVLHAAWALLLSNYSGDNDIVFGTCVNTNREASGFALGPFSYALPVRVTVQQSASVVSWLKTIEAHLSSVQQQSNISLSRVQKLVGFTGAPIFESCIEALENDREFETYGAITLREPRERTQDYPLIVAADLNSGALRISGDGRRFDEGAIAQMLSHLELLLDGIAANLEKPLSSVTLLTPEAEHRVLLDWNSEKIDYPVDRCIPSLFELQVQKTPDHAAVVFDSECVTYRELNERANRLANYLRDLGVGPEVLVAICMDRSIDMIVAILATAKSGGAWLPLDPSYPVDRLGLMLEDAQPPVLLTHESMLGRLPSYWGLVVSVDTVQEDIAERSSENPVHHVAGQNLAYVIYTSGSTGKPKAAMVPHRGICNTAEEMVRTFAPKPGTRLLQFASLSFDMSIFDIVPALISGATLYLVRQDSVMGQDLAHLLEKYEIDSLTIPPSVLATVPDSELPRLTSIRVAGEAASAELLARWLPGRQLYNAYGPAEGSIWVTGEFVDDPGVPSIGRPIRNTHVYVLDAALQPVAIGVPGELCFSGVGVTRGYLNQPAVTAEKFVPNPFSSEPGDRLYRTGDLVRYLPDGRLEFLGRVDDQVKIQGFRIELGEIESLLSAHPAVRQVSVLAREDNPGDRRLVAYLVLKTGQASTTSDFRSYLRAKLPEPMIPSAFVVLDSMPLTSNGKLDRKALPKPDFGRPELEMEFLGPRNETEEVLAGIFGDVLGIDGVGIRDSFFDLGGHSLLATQLISRIRTSFQVDLPLAHIFTGPTVEQLAELIANDRSSINETQAPPIVRLPRHAQHA